MKKGLCIIVLLALISACGSFNKGTAELHINKNITTGQELMDLQTALDKDIITQEEFDVQKEKILSEPETIIIDIDESEDKEESTTVIKVTT
ncbi:hypothetical protein OAS41_02500 [Candidatus Marinimicrobia bacterium]|nr:gas vesicle protein GvpG [bacterium]MDA7641945.1 gas vesicle protein GvpG [Candidatus Neomarinimicrobiota bacterium]MDB3887722.1 gas vesicle protein GvpG [Candidatus Neomarinimicrobiota bacterium]MDB3979942.1 gas vesicle protein GvpG [Candidatus Neomarinimicrobiota bacterium]MDC0521657.1 gas vesicle protein GvpG [Candidatus Neomarinimicrobiota bacterium]